MKPQDSLQMIWNVKQGAEGTDFPFWISVYITLAPNFSFSHVEGQAVNDYKFSGSCQLCLLWSKDASYWCNPSTSPTTINKITTPGFSSLISLFFEIDKREGSCHCHGFPDATIHYPDVKVASSINICPLAPWNSSICGVSLIFTILSDWITLLFSRLSRVPWSSSLSWTHFSWPLMEVSSGVERFQPAFLNSTILSCQLFLSYTKNCQTTQRKVVDQSWTLLTFSSCPCSLRRLAWSGLTTLDNFGKTIGTFLISWWRQW